MVCWKKLASGRRTQAAEAAFSLCCQILAAHRRVQYTSSQAMERCKGCKACGSVGCACRCVWVGLHGFGGPSELPQGSDGWLVLVLLQWWASL
jgi:hypothetical protein